MADWVGGRMDGWVEELPSQAYPDACPKWVCASDNSEGEGHSQVKICRGLPDAPTPRLCLSPS